MARESTSPRAEIFWGKPLGKHLEASRAAVPKKSRRVGSIPPSMQKPISRLLLWIAKQPHHHPVLSHTAEILARVRPGPMPARHAIRPGGFDDVVPFVVVEIARRHDVIAARLRIDGDGFRCGQ